MAENKTRAHKGDVQAFLNAITPDQRRADALEVASLMERLSGEKPVMWGPSIVGFGTYHYRYESGREGDSMRVGFSPRKTALALYIMTGFGLHEGLMGRLGKYKTGKSCLYINKLADVDREVLASLITASLTLMREKYPD